MNYYSNAAAHMGNWKLKCLPVFVCLCNVNHDPVLTAAARDVQ